MKGLKYFIGLIILAGITFSACNDDDDENISESNANYQIRLTDKPAIYDAVNIELDQVRVHHESEGWIDMNTYPGIYDLLTLTAGIDTVIADDEIPAGLISQIRLILGNDNTVVAEGESYDLTVPSGAESGLKINLHQELEEGEDYYILLDFDAAQSIILTGNGDYLLKPVIHAIAESVHGGISGRLEPEIAAEVYAINQMNQDSTGTYTDGSGSFLIQGLEEGMYTVSIVPDEAYTPATFEDIEVEAGETTNLGIISME